MSVAGSFLMARTARQRPAMVTIEEKIRHLKKKIETATNNRKKTKKDEEKAETEIADFQSSLDEVEKAAKLFEGRSWNRVGQ